MDIFERLVSPEFFLFIIVFVGLFYLNQFYLIPQLFFKKHLFLYFFILGVLLAGVYFLKPFDQLLARNLMGGNPPPPPRGGGPQGSGGPHTDIISLIVFAMVWAISFAICLLDQWRTAIQRTVAAEARIAHAEADKANAELSFLKAQINPHFLFNTLNNIYSLTVNNSPKAPDAVMRLSNIMRYVTDEAILDFVPLEDEINCLTDYINLQKLRLNDKTHVSFTVNGNIESKKIAPLILMTFIENVFKHGISGHEESPITIAIEATKTQIKLSCSNRIFNREEQITEERSGTGVRNNKKRLDYLYPDKHLLHISKIEGIYFVDLTLISD